MPDVSEPDGLSLDFAEQIEFFRGKLNLPTEQWDDILKSAHDRAFVVAGATQADLLADLRGAVDAAIAEGKSLGWFRQQFSAIVAKNGWTGWTGQGTAEGEAWRTQVIYQTNLATSYAAGRYQQLKANAAVFPWWMYVHAEGVQHPRPDHLAWHGLILAHDDPFWLTHTPPNGWGCHCSIRGVTRRDMRKQGRTGPDTAPDIETNPKTGAPVGIDRGWDYQPGAAANTPLVRLVSDKLMRLDAPIGAEMAAVLSPVIAAEQRVAWQALVDKVATTMRPQGEAVLAGAVSPATLVSLAELGVELETAGVWLRDTDLAHGLRDTKAERGATLPLELWRNLPELLAGAATYWDKQDPALIYAFDVAGEKPGKVVVRVNHSAKLRDGGERKRLTGNFIVTGGFGDVLPWDAERYRELKK